MRIGGLAAVIVALATACPAEVAPPAPATLDDTLDVTGEALAAREAQSRLAVGVTVDGRGPFRFLVDSGADRTVIGAGLALRLGLPSAGAVLVNDMAGRRAVGTVRIASLGVGASRVADIVAPALPEAFVGAQGILGIDALADERVMLDFVARAVTIQDSRRKAAALPGEIVVTARRRHGQLILTLTWVGLTRLYAIVDTGSEVTIGNAALMARVVRSGRLAEAEPVTLTGVTGATVPARMVRLPRLGIGSLTLADVPVAFAEVRPFALFGLEDKPALLLGNDVLRAFARVSLDFRARRVRFQPRGDYH